MPRTSDRLAPHTRVSVVLRFLKDADVLEALHGRVDTNNPRTRLYGTILRENFSERNKKQFEIQFDDLPNQTYTLGANCLRYEGKHSRVDNHAKEAAPVGRVSSDQENANLLEDAASDFAEDSDEDSDEDSEGDSVEEGPAESLENRVEVAWKADIRTVDPRLAGLDDHRKNCQVNISSESSLTKYFLSFLPVDHICSTVIPAINLYATAEVSDWVPITFPEYLVWIGLLIVMTTNVISDKNAYWHQSDFAFAPIFDFSAWMDKDRFDLIAKMHIFVAPSPQSMASDALYQIRFFVDAYNENLKSVIVPGRNLCVDECNSQWLGYGMLNLRKTQKRSHSADPKWNTLVDADSGCIIRLDITGDRLEKRFDKHNTKKIASVRRLVEPWFDSYRTVIANSRFGSPAMVRSLDKVDLYSIMQVEKKKDWPVGMPTSDMVASLGEEIGSTFAMSSTIDYIYATYLNDRKLKCMIANASVSANFSGPTVTRRIDGRDYSFKLPLVFEEYEAKKSAADNANNSRDNLPSFCDVMKTYRWEVRCLAFFLAIAEANAFSAYQYVEKEKATMQHYEFRCCLARSLLEYANTISGGELAPSISTISNTLNTPSMPEASPLRPHGSGVVHQFVSLCVTFW